MPTKGISRRSFLSLAGTVTGAVTLGLPHIVRAADLTLRYGHMNTPTSVNGQQAEWFAEEVARNTGGKVKIQVFPSSQLGSIKELAEDVSTGSIALSHNTAGALSTLYGPISALDTPYIYRDVDQLMKVVDAGSPVMSSLNNGMIKRSGVRVLYAFYFGTRQLSANLAVHQPSGLHGVKIRAIPSPIYMATVEGLGAVPVPVDWSEVPTALATGVVSGQENPVDVVLDNKLYEEQSHLMLTSHIRAAELVVVNEDHWKSFSPDIQAAFVKAADTVRAKATKTTLAGEAKALAALKAKGMKVIGPDNGLELAKFEASVHAVIDKKFGKKYGEIYKQISAMA